MHPFYSFLADAILVVHALIVFFNVAALPVIWVGYFRRWRFVRNFAFRLTHLVLIAFVTAEAVLGIVCPLTTWEDNWLTKAGEGGRYERGFVGYWVHRLLFYDFSEQTFAIAYSLFLLLVIATFIWVKPRFPHRSGIS